MVRLFFKNFRHISLCLLLYSYTTVAQEMVSGYVTDETGTPLEGVSVSMKSGLAVASTDGKGHYSISAKRGDVLIFSYVGYSSKEIEVRDALQLDVTMELSQKSLDEVVVVGYGTVKKRDLTGAVSSIKSEELNAFPTSNIVQAMSGRVAGVQVSQNNGAPGGAVSVRIRGANSIQGDNEPLYVVDGFMYSGGTQMLNPSDIVSVEVLKDASATAIYGSRGANGVVLITTKNGGVGRTKVEIEHSYSSQQIRKKLDLMNASEYAIFHNQRLINDGEPAYFENPESYGEGTDWQDEVLRIAPLNNTTLAINGGSGKTKFSIGSGYFNQKGIAKGNDYDRFTLRARVNNDISDYLSVDISALFTEINNVAKNSGGGDRGYSMFSGMITAPPTAKPYDDNGKLTELSMIYPFVASTIRNPLNYIYEQDNESISERLLLNGALSIKPSDALTIRLSGGLYYTNDRSNNYTTTAFYGSTGSASLGSVRYRTTLSENTVEYNPTVGESHSLSVLAGFTYQSFLSTSLSASGSGFFSDAPGPYNLAAAEVLGIPGSGFSDWKMLSYLGRINYSYRDKYLATVSFRADGSSRYSEGNKWGAFPSAALAWRISSEPFMEDISFVSDMKLRLGYGETGSTAIAPYYTLNMLSSGKIVLNDDLVNYYSPGTRLPSPLRWESTAQTNIGLDLMLFNSRYGLTIDYYNKITRDLLNSVQLPSSLGYTTTIQNIGKIKNYGLEIALDAKIVDNAFQWNVSPNIAFNRNVVLALNKGEDIIGSSFYNGIITDFINIVQEGEPLGIFYGYKETGYDENGKITYEDVDGNGLSFADKRKIGDPNPNFTYGLNSSMSYKRFDLDIFFQGTYGNDIYNFASMAMTQDYGYGLNAPRDLLNNNWTPENPNAKYPRLSRTNAVRISDRFVEDGSFLRLKNIQLGYRIDLNKWGWANRAKIYVSGQNLLTWTGYSWFDPEINYAGGANSINQGIDYYTYPVVKSVTMGIKLDF